MIILKAIMHTFFSRSVATLVWMTNNSLWSYCSNLNEATRSRRGIRGWNNSYHGASRIARHYILTKFRLDIFSDSQKATKSFNFVFLNSTTIFHCRRSRNDWSNTVVYQGTAMKMNLEVPRYLESLDIPLIPSKISIKG